MELYKDKNITVSVPAATVRAIDVAAAANNKLLIISNDPILSPLAADGVIAVDLPCPCGNYKRRDAICVCQIEDIHKHISDLRIKYASFMYCENVFCYAQNIKISGVDEMGLAMLKQAYLEFVPTVQQIVIILKSAKAIAEMENSKTIEACHIAEAISYRMPKD